MLWRGMWARLLAVLALAGVLAVALGGCEISQDAIKKDPFLQELQGWQQANAGQPVSSAEVQGNHKLGEPFKLDNTQWTIKETHAARALKLGDTILQAKGVYVVIGFGFE